MQMIILVLLFLVSPFLVGFHRKRRRRTGSKRG